MKKDKNLTSSEKIAARTESFFAKNAKLLAGAVHLYHKEKTDDRASKNMELLQDTIENSNKKAILGADQYI